MNDRIRELALQAEKFKTDEDSYLKRLHNRYNTIGDMEEEIFREKFAELIVKECLEICRSDDWEDQQGWGKLYAHKIKKHFGVEE